MSAPPISREEAFARARAVLDRARARRDTDRAAGRLAPDLELECRRLERIQRQQRTAAPDRAAA